MTISSSGNVQVVLVDVSGRESEPKSDPWLGLGLALFLFAATAILVRGRSPQRVQDRPSRWLRVVYTASTFGGALTLILVAEHFWLGRSAAELFPDVVIALPVAILMGIVLFGITEFWTGFIRPARTRGWLAGAILLFAGLIAGMVAVISLYRNAVNVLLHPYTLLFAVLGAIAGLIWWSQLPVPRQDVGKLFE